MSMPARTWRLVVLSIISSAISFHAGAESPDPASTPATETIVTEPAPSAEEPGIFSRWFEGFISARDTTSRKYVSMSRSIDRYFAGEKIEETENDSYLKLTMAETFLKNGERIDNFDLKAKVELPNTQKRLKLVFTSSPDEEKTLEERIENTASGEKIDKEGSVAGIQFDADPTKRKWKQTYTAGIKLRSSGLVPVAKYKIGNQWKLDPLWTSRFEQSFWYIDDRGFGATNKINFDRPLTDIHTLNLESDVEYKDDEDRYTYAFIISDHQRLSQTSGMQHRIGCLGQSQPTNWITSYFIGTTYRKALYKDWFFLETGPQLSFPRNDGWKPTPSFTLRFEVYFSE